MAKGELIKIGLKHNTDKAFFHNYLDFYEEHLPDRDFDGRLLEIGVMKGASLRMWREYYPKAEIVGIDIRPPLSIEGVTVLELDGTDEEQVNSLGKFDIILDDGSHMTADQQKSLKILWKQLNKGGFYIMEDMHTSFMPNYINSEETTFSLLKKRKDVVWKEDKADSITGIIKK